MKREKRKREKKRKKKKRRKRKKKKKMMMMKRKKKKEEEEEKGSHSLSTNSESVRNRIFKSPKPLEIVTCCLHKSYKMKPSGEVVSVHPCVYFISVTTQ